MAISEKLGYHDVVLSALSTRQVALEASAELGCAAHALGQELAAWAGDGMVDLNVGSYAMMLGRAVARAAALMNGAPCESCEAEGVAPNLHAMSGRTGVGIWVTVRGMVPGL